MALQRPRFQIDGEFDGNSISIPNGGDEDIVNITGPGLIKEASYSFDTISGGDFDLTRLVITVDGVIIFNKDIDETELVTQSGISGSLGDFHLDVLVADDTFDMTLKDMAFISDFRIQFFQDTAPNWIAAVTGATLWHKGA